MWVDEYRFDELPYCSPSRLDDDIKDEMFGTIRINEKTIIEESEGAFDWYYEEFHDKVRKMVIEDDGDEEQYPVVTRVCLGPIQGSTLACNELIEIILELIEDSRSLLNFSIGIVDNGFDLWLDPN